MTPQRPALRQRCVVRHLDGKQPDAEAVADPLSDEPWPVCMECARSLAAQGFVVQPEFRWWSNLKKENHK